MEAVVDFFEYRNGELFAEGVPVRRIAQEVGTPTYVYSLATLRRHYRVFDRAFMQLPHLICFSVKSNSNLAVLRVFSREGGGFDIVSGGELYREGGDRPYLEPTDSLRGWEETPGPCGFCDLS